MSAGSEVILDKLKRREFVKLDTFTKTHTSKLKKSSNYSELAKFAHSFVRRVSVIIKNAELRDSTFLIELALFCNECSWRDGQVPADESLQDVTKALYGILEFLSKQNRGTNGEEYDLIIQTSNHLDKYLESWNPGNELSKSISLNSCFYLSKLADEYLKRKNSGENDDKMCFTLQKLGLKFLAREKDPERFTKLCKHAKRFAFDYINTGKTDFSSLLLYCEDTFRQVCLHFESVEQNLLCFTAVFEFLLGWLYLLFNNSSAWKVDSLNIVANWDQFAVCLKKQPNLQQLWNCNFHAFELTVYFHFLEKVNEKSKKVIEDATSRCVEFLQNNNNRDYDEVISKSLLFLWDSLKKNFDASLERINDENFGFYCQQMGNLLLGFMNWEFSKEKKCNDKTLIILKTYFSLFDHRLNHILKNDADAKIKDDLEIVRNVMLKFGNAFIKFGIVNYTLEFVQSVCKISLALLNKKLYEYTVLVCSFAQEDMIRISHQSSSFETFEKSFWPFARCYVRSLNQLQRHEDSLDFIARVLAADCKVKELAIQLWAKTKLTGKLSSKISIFDLLPKYISDKKANFDPLLILEANAICECGLKLRVDVSDDVRYIVNQLKCRTIKKIDKAVLLITKAKLLGVGSNNLTSDLLQYCDEAIDIFRRNQTSSKSSQVACYLAHSYFYRYVIESRLKSDKLAEKITNCSTKKLGNYATISTTLKSTSNLDLALNIWTSVISLDMKLIPCLKNCLKDLLGIASAYSVQCMTKNEFKSWMLALKVAKELNDDLTVGNVSCQIANIFCRYGLTVQATEYLFGAKEAIEKSNDKVVGDNVKEMELKYLKLLVDVCSSETLLLQNEVVKGWQCLRNALKEIETLSKSKSALLLSIEAKLLKSKYLELPFSILPSSERDCASPLEVISDGYNVGFSIINYAYDYRNMDITARIINSFFDAAMQLGKLCLDIGDPAMALLYLEKPLKWACKFSLSKRVSDILIIKAKINVMSDDFESCQSDLRTIRFIFHSQAKEPAIENEFEDEELAPESIISANPFDDFEDMDSLKDKGNSSPVLENLDMKDHVSNCTCALCEQFLFPITCLEFSFLQAQCFYLKNVSKDQAICILRKKRQKFEIISSRIASLILESLSAGNTKLSGISSSNIYSSFHLLKLDVINKLITFSLSEGAFNDAHVMAKTAMEEAKSLFWIGFQDLRVALAQIRYSYCLAKILKHAKSKKVPVSLIFNQMWSYATRLPASEIDFELEFDFLESKVRDIRLNDVEPTDRFKTPKQNSRSTRIAKCKAPGRNKLMCLRPNQCDEFLESVPIMRDHQASGDKENEDTLTLSNVDSNNLQSKKNVRRKLLLSKTITASSGVLKEMKVDKERNKEHSENFESITKHFVSFLESVIDQIAHFPVYPLYGDLQFLIALCKGNQRIDSAIHLFESCGLTLRHRSLVESNSRIKNCEDTCQDLCSFMHLVPNVNKHSNISFEKRLNDMTNLLDEDIVVCQINTLPKVLYDNSQQLNSELIITRLQKGRKPLVIKVPNDDSRVVKGFLNGFQNLLDEHHNNSKLVDKVACNALRVDANDKVKVALTNMEDRWLDHWKGLLLGSPAIEADRRTLRKIVKKLNLEFSNSGFPNVDLYILEMIVDSLPWLSSTQLRQVVASLLLLEKADDLLLKLCKTVRHYAKPLCSKTISRQPLILVLDKAISFVPWESIPILTNNAVTRMPSIYSILVHASLNQCPKQIDSSKTFYVLDPESNLPGTAQRFDSFFKPLNWPGICQRRPSKTEWEAAVKDNELFIYCGHGNGRNFYDSKSLTNQVCKAALILSGCSSVKLRAINYFEANGDVLQYIMAGSPCVVGTLWGVTDVEIDSVVMKLLSQFLPTSEARKTMCEALVSARTACKLPYLTGAATIIYGMPVIAK